MLNVTIYHRPYGRTTEEMITGIRPDDAKYLGDFEVSMEEPTTGQFVLYCDTGLRDIDGEPVEIIHIVPQGQTCEDAMSVLRQKTEELMGDPV